MSETRFIKTKVDDKPKVLHLLSCNLCPMLMYDKEHKLARCMRFSDSHRSSVICTNVHSFSMYGNNAIPIQEVFIPKWCKLPSDTDSVMKCGDMFVRGSNDTYILVPNVFHNLVVMSGMHTDYDLKLEKLVSGKNRDGIYFPSYSNIRPLPEHKPVPTLGTCSCCGELKDKVNRDKNYGMCDKCWDEYKDNNNVKEFAYLNNFRLKRNSTWSDERYKKIKEIH